MGSSSSPGGSGRKTFKPCGREVVARLCWLPTDAFTRKQMVPELLGTTSPSMISLLSGSLSSPAFSARAIICATVTASWLSLVLPRTVMSLNAGVGAPCNSYVTVVSTPKEGVFHTNRSAILLMVGTVNTYSFKKLLVKFSSSDGSCATNENLPWSSIQEVTIARGRNTRHA